MFASYIPIHLKAQIKDTNICEHLNIYFFLPYFYARVTCQVTKISQHDIKLINIQKTGENSNTMWVGDDILLHIRSGCVPLKLSILA